MRRQTLFLFTVALLVLSGSVAQFHPVHAANQFNRIVIIAMENQNYGSVIGSGSAPFINGLAQAGSTIDSYHSYAQNIGGCSAGCYEAFTSGQQSHSDGWCPRSSSPCFNIPNVANQLQSAGLSSAMFCEDGCPRGADHFPWIAYTNTWNSCLTGSFTCSGQTGPVGNALYGSSSGNGNSAFINYLNGANPANYIWFTPTDSHNMHDNSVSSGDAYLQNLLVGSGSVTNPSANSVLGSNIFKTPGTFLYLWWDEYDPSPNVEYGSMIKTGFTSSISTDEYDSLHTIESNWGMPFISSVVAGNTGIGDVFGASTGCAPNCPLTGSFTSTPSAPTAGQTITFTASASGGTAPYSFSWTLPGANPSSATGSTVTASYGIAGPYTVTLTTSDSASHSATSSQTVTVTTTGCGNNCPVSGAPLGCPTGIGTKTNPCQILGWGGIRLDEAAVGAGGHNPNTSTQASCCFAGETVTNMELALIREQQLGYNGVRVDFDPFCSDNTDSNFMSAYNAQNLQRALVLANHYSMWIIVDYHGFIDYQPTTSGLLVNTYPNLQSCWLGFWSGVVNQFKNSYKYIVWEPLNEPCPGTILAASGSCPQLGDVATLSTAYQAWINQARTAGDTHWIVAQNLCSNACSFADFSQGYPTVTDPSNLIFISLHFYMGFPYVSPWSLAEADAYASQFVTWMQSGQSKTGWPILNTEGGTDPLCSISACPNAGFGTCSTPPQTCGGSAGFTAVTFEFVKKITTLMNANSPPMGWLLWTAGSWTDTPGNLVLGGLDPTNWGTTLGPQSITSTGGGGGNLNLYLTTVAFIGVGALIAVAGLAVAMPRRRGGQRQGAQ